MVVFLQINYEKHPQLGGDFDVLNMKSDRICALKIVVLCTIWCSVRDISRQPESFWIKRNVLQCVIKQDMRFTVSNSAPVCQLLTNCSQRSHWSIQCVFAVSEDRSVTETERNQWQNRRPNDICIWILYNYTQLDTKIGQTYLSWLILTTSGAASDENFIKMNTSPFSVCVPWVYVLTHWPLGDLKIIFKMSFPNSYPELIPWAIPAKLFSEECHRTPLMISQLWFR